MIQNIIIGKNSFVTLHILKYLKNSKVYSANDSNIEKLIKEVNKFKKINIIFNNFFPSNSLNKLSLKDYGKFCYLSINRTIILLKNIKSSKINKIIYTSSSSVNDIALNLNNTNKDNFNRELYSSFKLAVEKLISNYANKKNKKYYIMRVFNTYGNKQDKFSFIEKIIRAKRNNEQINLINEGLSLRDFIHLDDIGKIYKIFIRKNLKKGIYNVGTGKGFAIKDLIYLSDFSKNKINKINKVQEISNSIANTQNLISQIKNYKFRDLRKYIKKSLKVKKTLNIKTYSHNQNKQNQANGVVIYGAGNAGQQIYNELIKNKENVLCFVDDNKKIHNTILHSIPVISYEDLFKLKINLNVKKIYLSIPSLSKKTLSFKLKKIKKNFFDVRFLPEKKFLLSDQININDINIDEINSILNRKQIKIKKIKKLRDKNVLVTGAGGTIGSEICRQLLQQQVKKIVAIDKSELAIYNLQKNLINRKVIFNLTDVCNIELLEKIINKENINIIFHTAAYKHVNILEHNLFSAVKNNVFATNNLCNLLKKYNCEMVFISTDKAANPKSILGYSKRFAEKVCENFNRSEKHKKLIKIVRFGNVFGSSGSAITNFIDKINSNEPIILTDKRATRYFMTIHEACHLVLQTIDINIQENTFILNMGKPLNILNLAKELGKIKSKINPNYNFEYKEIGLQPGEKLHENIVDRKETIKKFNNEIFLVRRKQKIKLNFNVIYKNLRECYQEMNKKQLLINLTKIKNF
tara:strand:+ start:1835 stop:4084 length:2250 start_codon:yes stop_codon:yes gene_type:complete